MTRSRRLLFLLAAVLGVTLAVPALAEDVRTITITAVGDCTLGRNYKMDFEGSWDDLFEQNGPGYFLQNVSGLFHTDDLTIANLEGVLSDSAPRQIRFYDQKRNRISKKKYCHLGRPEYLEALTLGGVDVVSFANNHNIDYGLKGFTDTLDACDRCGLPAAYYDTLVRREVSGLTVGVISIDTTYCDIPTAEGYLRRGMADLRTDCDLIVACMHWGKNYEETPDAEQQYFGHLCVDLGADLVLGCHAHILQGIERYRGRYIFYSLGNFTYGGRAVPKDVDTLIARQTFTFVDGVLQVDDSVTLLPCWMSTRTEVNDFCPLPQSGGTGAAILHKINRLSSPLGLSFDAEGRPSVGPADDTLRPPRNTPAQRLSAPRVPDILYTLLTVPEGGDPS